MTESPEPPEEGSETPSEKGLSDHDHEAAVPAQQASGDVPPRRWASTTGAVVLVCLATALGVTQIAGLLLRDRVEHRVATLAEPPPTSAPGITADTPARSPSRLGAEVREVVVGTAPVPEAPTTQTEPPEPPTPVEPDIAETPQVTSAEPTTPPRAGTGLQVGIFRSQKYRKDAEDTLDRLGAPRFRLQTTRRGVGFRLVVPAPTADARNRVASILGERGVLSQRAGDRVVAYFHLEEEVQAVLGALSQVGIQAGYGRFEGDMPLWTVLAGPFDEAEVNLWETRLHQAGLDTYRRTQP